MVNMNVLVSLLVMAGVSHGLSILGLAPPGYPTDYRDITGNATCDDEMWLHADGVLKMYDSEWSKSSPITLPWNTRVVAIMCRDSYNIIGGIKAAFSNGERTDHTWKCSNHYYTGWETVGFDDSHWEYATIAEHPRRENRPEELHGKAEWIWTTGWYGQDKEVFCRKDFSLANLVPQPPPQPFPHPYDITGYATCDNIMRLYTDGVERANHNDWRKALAVTIPANTRVLAIACQDLHGTGGIKAYFNNGVKTDESWKCSTHMSHGWNQAGYDDRNWQTATVFPDWIDLPHELRGRAHWIWTTGYTGQDTMVYCRKELNAPYVPPPTQPPVPSGYDCAAHDPCRNIGYDDVINGHILYPHRSSSSMFIECEVSGQCMEKYCEHGMKWNQQARFCVN